MEQPTIRFLRIPHDGVETKIPARATAGSAGFDLCAAVTEPVALAPRALVRIPTGIAVGLPSKDFVALVFARSGLAIKHGVALSNGVGVVDSDYTGEIAVGLCNLSDEPYTVAPGERIAQLVVLPVAAFPAVEVPSLDATERGAGGFGSTGRF